MDNRIQNSKIADLIQGQTIAPTTSTPATGTTQSPAAAEFGQILDDRLKVSGHAQTRMSSRNISLSDNEWQRVMGGVQKAAAKGAKESLVMVDDVALVVSVKNRTVITAVDKDSLKENVFTNIDSAVIV